MNVLKYVSNNYGVTIIFFRIQIHFFLPEKTLQTAFLSSDPKAIRKYNIRKCRNFVPEIKIKLKTVSRFGRTT